MTLADGAKFGTPVWSCPAGWDAVGLSKGVARVCRASALNRDFTLGVLCGASCGD